MLVHFQTVLPLVQHKNSFFPIYAAVKSFLFGGARFEVISPGSYILTHFSQAGPLHSILSKVLEMR
jgi:hypothetical protein